MSETQSTPNGNPRSTVYFVQAATSGLIKIGCTDDVGRRLRQLQARHGEALTLLGTLPNTQNKEAELHRRFAHLRRRGKEWFEPAAELLTFIRLNADRPDLPPLPPPRLSQRQYDLTPADRREAPAGPGESGSGKPEPQFIFLEDPAAPPEPNPAVIGALVDFLLRRVEEELRTAPRPPEGR